MRALIAACAFLAAAAGSSAAQAQQNSGAIGQIEPRGGVIALGGPMGAIVSQVHVSPGDLVKAGDLLVTLQGDGLKAEQELAQADLAGARKIAQSQAAAQNLAIDAAKERLAEATHELDAYRSLGARSVTGNEMAHLETAEAQARIAVGIEQTKLQSVRTESEKSVQTAAKRLQLANAAMEIRAPSDGTILKIDRRPGQPINAGPVIEMGDLSAIYVTCQIFQGDLLSLKPGMKATIRNAALTQPLTGTVEEVSRLVETRSRLGEVRVKLDGVEPANRLIGMEVEVVIAR